MTARPPCSCRSTFRVLVDGQRGHGYRRALVPWRCLPPCAVLAAALVLVLVQYRCCMLVSRRCARFTHYTEDQDIK